jgi:hypothetical protein
LLVGHRIAIHNQQNIVSEPGLRNRTEYTRPEIDLLLHSVHTSLNRYSIEHIRTLSKQAIDWVYLLRIAQEHGVAPLLFQSLKNVCPEVVPQNILTQLRTGYYITAGRNHLLTIELVKLLKLFTAHNIPTVPFKGPVLAISTYGNLACRQFDDLDILIHPSDVCKAKELLVSRGYQPDHRLQLSWEAHFTRAVDKITVDLHWGITPELSDKKAYDPSFPLDLKRVWKRLRPIVIAEMSTQSFAPEDFLLIRCQDATKEYIRQHWPRLRWICDVSELIRTHPELDWEQLIERAQNLGSQRILYTFLRLARDLLGTPIPQHVQHKFQVDPQVNSLALEACNRLFSETNVSARFYDSQWGYLNRNLAYIRLKERWRDKIPYYLRIVEYYRRMIRRVARDKNGREVLPLPESLSYLYYVIVCGYYLLWPIWCGIRKSLQVLTRLSRRRTNQVTSNGPVSNQSMLT